MRISLPEDYGLEGCRSSDLECKDMEDLVLCIAAIVVVLAVLGHIVIAVVKAFCGSFCFQGQDKQDDCKRSNKQHAHRHKMHCAEKREKRYCRPAQNKHDNGKGNLEPQANSRCRRRCTCNRSKRRIDAQQFTYCSLTSIDDSGMSRKENPRKNYSLLPQRYLTMDTSDTATGHVVYDARAQKRQYTECNRHKPSPKKEEDST